MDAVTKMGTLSIIIMIAHMQVTVKVGRLKQLVRLNIVVGDAANPMEPMPIGDPIVAKRIGVGVDGVDVRPVTTLATIASMQHIRKAKQCGRIVPTINAFGGAAGQTEPMPDGKKHAKAVNTHIKTICGTRTIIAFGDAANPMEQTLGGENTVEPV